MKAIIITIALIIASGTAAYADYHYASHDGSNEYPYTSWETGAHLIQDAVDATNPHDTLYIGAGEWYQSAAVEDHDSIAIIGMGTDSTFMYTDEYRVYLLIIDYNCSVEGITFQHLDDWVCIWGRTYASVKIKDCRFNNSRTGVQLSGGHSEVSNCVFDSCEKAINNGWTTDNIIISNNLVLNAYDFYAIRFCANISLIQNNIVTLGPNSIINGMLSFGTPDSSIIRNNIVMGGSGGIVAGLDLEYNNTVKDIVHGTNSGMYLGYLDLLYNNSITNCKRALSIQDSCYFNYNNLWNNRDSTSFDYFIEPVGNISENPMFLSSFDVHLQAYSPLIDAGDPAYLDIDGSGSDIGAYGGQYGESYLYLDLPPAIPDSLTGQHNQDTIVIAWRFNTESDFSYYLLYKDTISGFEPSAFNLIAEPDTSHYVDADVSDDHNYYYLIASIDNQENVSDYSNELEIIMTDIWNQPGATLPQITSIKMNYPNPFNNTTAIVYHVANLGPVPAEIKITIYDIRGRKIRTLVNDRKEVGEHVVIWDGRNDNGDECSSGVYFARISQWGLDIAGKPRKLVLIK